MSTVWLVIVTLLLWLAASSCGDDPAPDEPFDLVTDIDDATTDGDLATDPTDGDGPVGDEDAADSPEDELDEDATGVCSTDACDDGIACTTDDCFEQTGGCENVPDHSLCADEGGVCSVVSGCIAPADVLGVSPVAPARIIEDPVSGLKVVESEAIVRLVDGATAGDLQDALDTLPFDALIIGRLYTLPFAQVLFTDLEDQAELRDTIDQVSALEPVAAAWVHPAGFVPTLLPDAGSDAGYVDPDSGVLLDTAWHLEQIDAETAWDTTTGSDSVTLGLLDVGFATELAELDIGQAISFESGSSVAANAENLGPLAIYTLPELISHGTFAGGLIGAEGNSVHGQVGDVVGVMWEAGFIGVRVDGTLLATFAGAEAVAMGAIATSDETVLLYLGQGQSYYLDPSADSSLIHAEFAPTADNNYAVELVDQNGEMFESLLSEYPNLLIVQGAGNEGLHDVEASFSGLACAVDDPDLADQVLCVASSTSDGEVATISNRGGDPIAAPGGDLDHGLYGLTYEGTLSEEPVAGTSAAAAVATGVAGLILSANPDLEPEQVHDILLNSGQPIEPEVDTAYDGFSTLDAAAGVEAAEGCVDGVWNPETSNCCVPDCSLTECGPDPICGEPCGDCGCGEDCDAGLCLFTACDDRDCGEDGCGGDCENTCNYGDACEAFACVAATVLTVTTDDDVDDDTCDEGHCSLREAIAAAEDIDGPSRIEFAIEGEPPFVISPTSALPWVWDDIAIDGTTQPGYEGIPVVELDGSGAGDAAHGLFVYGDHVSIRGLAIYGFDYHGIFVSYTTDVRVEGCFLGLSPSDSEAPGNGHHGIEIGGIDNTIGGLTADAGNVISGNGQYGVSVVFVDSSRGEGASGIRVIGNRIGTTADGLSGRPNKTGVRIFRAEGTVVGGTEPGAGNLISGNTSFGIRDQQGVGSVIQGNLVGTDLTGATAVPNGTEDANNEFRGGIVVEDSEEVTVGGDQEGARNIVAGNHGDGIRLRQSDDAVVQGNWIGLGTDGSTAIGNTRHGLNLQTCQFAQVGGPSERAGNVIADNEDGIHVEMWVADLRPATGTVVSGNRVGTSADGLEERGNRGHGIWVDAGPGVIVGGVDAGDGNVVAFNTGAAIRIGTDTTLPEALEVAVLGNLWEGNSGLGIDVGADGFNDAIQIDPTVAPYGPPNPPQVAFTGTTDADARIVGIHTGYPNTAYRIELFTSSSCAADQSEDGELVGTLEQETDATGSFMIDLSVSDDLALDYSDLVADGVSIVATATRGTLDEDDVFAGQATSELSACVLFGAGVSEPVAVPDEVETDEDLPAVFSPQSNDLVALDAGTLQVVDLDAVEATGTIAIEEDGASVRYTPVEDFNGDEWFRYTVEDENGSQAEGVVIVSVLPVNDPPIAVPDEASVLAGGSVEVDVLANDSDVDEDTLFVSSFSDPAEATVTETVDGNLLITLLDSATGSFTVEYVASDGELTNDATLTVTRYSSDVHSLTVTTTDDVSDGECDETHCSLREAIEAASFVPGENTVSFAITGDGPYVIHPESPLPEISGDVFIDGTSQDGFDSEPIVEIDGSGAGDGADGLVVNGSGAALRGLAVYGFEGRGIVLQGSGATITGCWIGLTPAATSVSGNSSSGIEIDDGIDNIIGGVAAGDQNVIAGNGGSGVRVTGSASTGNRILGNVIGTDRRDSDHLGNADGISLSEAGPTRVGGAAAGEGNLISANGNSGIRIFKGGPHAVEGNWIGTDSTGSGPLGNEQVGVWVDWSADVQIGCADPGCGNVIGANGMEGIGLTIADGAIVEGNRIGVGVDGVTPIGNGTSFLSQRDHQNDEGIKILSGDNIRIGGPEAGQGNHIAANGTGIRVIFTGSVSLPRPTGLVIQGNTIGSDSWYRPELGNEQYGIYVRNVGEILIGGEVEGAGNLIGANGEDGLWASTNEAGTLDILGNAVGVDYEGLENLGNGRHGIALTRYGSVSSGRVGTDTTVAFNEVAFNGSSGVWLGHESYSNDVFQPHDVAILANQIHENGTNGIDLGSDDVTENDDGDSDDGPNDGQNFPILTDVSFGDGTVTLSGTLDTIPEAPVRIEFFANRFACPESDHGQGEQYLGYIDVTTDDAGHASFETTLTFEDDWPRRFTSTATATIERWVTSDEVWVTRRQTSEHSACLLADCTPDCSGRECGWNGCFGTCGECEETDVCANACNADGQCVNALDIELSCDLLDENCDGSVDEAFTSEGVYDLQGHCGTCDRSCSAVPYQGHTIAGTCDADRPLPACVYSCEVGYADANGLPNDGCECEIISESDPIEEAYPFIDANCDGVDGIDNDGDGFAAGEDSTLDCRDDDETISPMAWDWVDGVCAERTSWSALELDPTAVDYSRPTVLVDSEGDLAVVYTHHDYTSYARVLRRVDGVWHIEDFLATDKQIGAHSTDAALDADGAIWMTFRYDDPREIDGELRVARIAEGQITVETIDDGGGYQGGMLPSIALDTSGYAHIAYTNWDEFSRPSLHYATNTSGDWVSATVAPDSISDGTDITVDEEGVVHIVSWGTLGRQTVLFTNETGDWVSEEVDPDRHVRGHAAITLGASGSDVHVAYWADEEKMIYYAVRSESGWSASPVAPADALGPITLGIDGSGDAHIAWNTANYSGGRLTDRSSIVYATNASGDWSVSIPAGGVDGNVAPALAFDEDGQPLVAVAGQDPVGMRLVVGGDAETVCGTTVDMNCDGVDGVDGDGDGDADLLSGGADCDDDDGAIHSDAGDTVGDETDHNCDGHDGVDSDGDGYASEDSGGEDCRDDIREINPAASDTVGDETDNNCDGVDGVDGDGDGFANEASGGWDCEDDNTEVVPEDCTKTLVVISANDDDDGTCDGTHCSLREALTFANDYPGVTKVRFSISGSIPVVIAPTNPLPEVAGRVEIDGTTQSGFDGLPVVEIDGSAAGSTRGLVLLGGESIIRSLAIYGFAATGIMLEDGDDNLIAGCHVGTNRAQAPALGNGTSGIYLLRSEDNVIGGTGTNDGNLIVSNGNSAISINATSTGRNSILGNVIGVDWAGVTELGNSSGISISTALETTVGGPEPGAGNVIAGNANSGIRVDEGDVRIWGNQIGVEVDGGTFIGNDRFGIEYLTDEGLIVGVDPDTCPVAACGNEVVGNGFGGIYAQSSGGTATVSFGGNLIIGNGDGAPDGHFGDGLELQLFTWSGARIGAADGVGGNLISGNARNGLRLGFGFVSNAVIEGNLIGTEADGVSPLGNGGHGIETWGTEGARIGGTGAGQGNTIAFNGGDGIFLPWEGHSPSVRYPVDNHILGNSIHSNGGLAIDLDGDGLTPNDGPGDTDVGPNDLLNFPTLSVVSLTDTFVSFSINLEAEPSTDYRVDFYANTECDDSGYGEAEEYAGYALVTTLEDGTRQVDTSITGAFPVSTVFSANLTEIEVGGAVPVYGPTSEMSACVERGCLETCGCGETCDSSECVFHGCDGLGCGIEPSCGGDCGSCNEGYQCSNNQCAIELFVNSSLDDGDGECTVDECTLREAIVAANAALGPAFIGFEIAGDGPHTITPSSGLPEITNTVIIDGTTQSGWVDVPVIYLSGAEAGGRISGLVLSGPDSVVQGLAVSSFTNDGLAIAEGAERTRVEGCFFGVFPTSAVTGNGQFGVSVNDVDDVVIGGATAQLRNVISGNDSAGLFLINTERTKIQGNLVGIDHLGASNANYDGMQAVGAVDSIIGGVEEGEGNTIVANTNYGINLGFGSDNVIQGNFIGTNSDAAEGLGNGNSGVRLLDDSDDTIGGTASGAGNVIAHNGGIGVAIEGTAAADNGVLGNLVHSNDGLGLDLGADGVTPNDGTGDSDSGPNGLQNRPVLDPIVTVDTDSTISGTLTTAPGNYRVEFFSNTACDSSGSGEGSAYITSINVVVPGGGETTFETTVSASLTADGSVTATATPYTDVEGDVTFGGTSEFSACTAGACVPSCGTRVCGGNGCDGVCGTCTGELVCLGGFCLEEGTACDDGNETDWDGCTDGYVTEFLLDPDPTHAQHLPAVATLHEGGWVAAWVLEEGDANGAEVRAQIRDRVGAVFGATIDVNSTTGGSQRQPRVAGLRDNTFVVVWDGAGSEDSQGIYLSRFDANGSVLQDNVLVNTTTAGNQSAPQVSQYFYGGFVIVWRGPDPDSGDNTYFLRRYDATGAPVTGEVQLSGTTDPIGAPSAAFLEDGRVVVGWQGPTGGLPGTAAWAKAYTRDGASVADAGRVDPSDWTATQAPRFGLRSESNFAAVWESDGQDGDGAGVYVRVFGSTAVPRTDEAPLSETTTGDQTDPRVSGNSGGALVAVWTSDGQDGDGLGVFSRRFRHGLDITFESEIQVNAYSGGDQSEAHVSRFQPGAHIAVWTGPQESSEQTAIYARRYHTDGADCALGTCETTTYYDCPNECNDNNPCTTDSCDDNIGCLHTPLSDGAECGDGVTCQGAICL